MDQELVEIDRDGVRTWVPLSEAVQAVMWEEYDEIMDEVEEVITDRSKWPDLQSRRGWGRRAL